MTTFNIIFTVALMAFSIVSGLVIASPVRRWRGDSSTRVRAFVGFLGVCVLSFFLCPRGFLSHASVIAIFLPSLIALFPFDSKLKPRV